MVERTLLPNTPTTLASWALLLGRAIDSYGIDSAPLFADAGVSLEEARVPNARIPVHKMAKVWQAAVEHTGDPCVALRLTRFFQPNIYSAVGLSIASSRSIGEGLRRCLRFYQLTTDAAVLSLEVSQDEQSLVLTIPPENEPVAGEAVEAFCATMLVLFRTMLDDSFAPKAVNFQHSKDADTQGFDDFFLCEVRFSQPRTEMIFDSQQLEQEQLFANPVLTATLDEWMGQYLAQFKADLTSTKVQAYLLANLIDGAPEQQVVAKHFGLSVRALQRRLKEEETSFIALLDNCRQHLATKYVAEDKVPLAEITYMLGFSDQSNFARAFKRWTGVSPQAYRDNSA